jgi:hypothetical protein
MIRATPGGPGMVPTGSPSSRKKPSCRRPGVLMIHAFVVAHDQPLRALLRLSLDPGDPPAENQRR